VTNNKASKRARSAKAAADPPAHGSGMPVVIGIGGSAAAVGSLVKLFAKIAAGPDQAIVVVVQHREALDEQVLRQALASRNGDLSLVDDGAPVEGGNIYLSPPNVIVTI
jgi:two-component system, chemotaxis family, CheB/CheR fusion protein